MPWTKLLTFEMLDGSLFDEQLERTPKREQRLIGNLIGRQGLPPGDHASDP